MMGLNKAPTKTKRSQVCEENMEILSEVDNEDTEKSLNNHWSSWLEHKRYTWLFSKNDCLSVVSMQPNCLGTMLWLAHDRTKSAGGRAACSSNDSRKQAYRECLMVARDFWRLVDPRKKLSSPENGTPPSIPVQTFVGPTVSRGSLLGRLPRGLPRQPRRRRAG